MESDWRYDVWSTGWANSPIALVARLLNPFPPYTHFAWRPLGVGGAVLAGTADAQGWIPNWGTLTFQLKFPGNVEFWTGRE